MENIVIVDVVMERQLNSASRLIDSKLAKISIVFALSISKKQDIQVLNPGASGKFDLRARQTVTKMIHTQK